MKYHDGRLDGTYVLSELVHYRTYPAVKSNHKKETRNEVIRRVEAMHQTKFPWYSDEIAEAFKPVYSGHALPSMRSMQFGGYPIFRSNARMYNCAYAPLTEWKDFADLFWLLLNGVGVGYSVQQRHISQLPYIWGFDGSEEFVVEDSKEGWADAVLHVLYNPLVKIDATKVRARGEILSTGGVASGPEPLLQALGNIKEVLLRAEGQLRPIEAFDIMCYLADVVVVGAVRRAATIAQFDPDDLEMLTAKSGDWYDEHPHRMRANISAVVLRNDTSTLARALEHTFASGAGEPGVLLTNNTDWGFNPCAEISLRPRGFCNLTETNVAACRDEEEFLMAIKTAAIIGTLQASYTEFDYIHPDWRKNAEEEALLGVSMTGQAQNWGLLSADLLQAGARAVREENQLWAEMLDIKPAARSTTVKPAGNSSAWLGTTSGIHAAHADFFLRRVRVDRKDNLGSYLIENYGEDEPESGSFIERDKFNSENIVVTMPIKMAGAIKRGEESAVDLLERAKHVYVNWVLPGHLEGENTHNVSLTVSYKPEEQDEIQAWMLANSDYWAGVALLPYDGGGYIQAPFEEITSQEYYRWLDLIPQDLDLADIEYYGATDMRAMEMACAGPNGCEVT